MWRWASFDQPETCAYACIGCYRCLYDQMYQYSILCGGFVHPLLGVGVGEREGPRFDGDTVRGELVGSGEANGPVGAARPDCIEPGRRSGSCGMRSCQRPGPESGVCRSATQSSKAHGPSRRCQPPRPQAEIRQTLPRTLAPGCFPGPGHRRSLKDTTVAEVAMESQRTASLPVQALGVRLLHPACA